MTREQLHQIGCKLKIMARGSLLDYIEGTLPLLQTMMPTIVIAPNECHTCANRRRQKAEAQKKWRRNRR
jgi:hypothetical protein